MFIKVRGEDNEDILVNVARIRYIAPTNIENVYYIHFGDGAYVRSRTSIDEIGQMIAEGINYEKV